MSVVDHDPDGLCLQSVVVMSASIRGLGWGSESVVVEIEMVVHEYRQMAGAIPNLALQRTQ